ncbi:MAG: hypothetical protein ACREPU_01350 [Rhodanobacteraceae bacterium]
MKPFCLPVLFMGLLGPGTAFAANAPVRTAVQIHRALSAAPSAIADGATVVTWEGKGHITELRHGSNGWTCFIASGDPEPLPACFDANGMAWIRAYAAGRAPDPNKPGYSYMLQGGSAWSNTDPKATELPADRKTWIHIPPHVMILSSRIAGDSGFPSGQTNPNTRKPFVMFGGTKYAILIIPVK